MKFIEKVKTNDETRKSLLAACGWGPILVGFIALCGWFSGLIGGGLGGALRSAFIAKSSKDRGVITTPLSFLYKNYI